MNGVVNILKPPGMTSSDVVVRLRKILNTKKIGHTGTLDPAACGVLPICIGRGTKIADYIMNEHKEYIACFCFGQKTDTQDSMGKVIASCDKKIDIYNLKEIIPFFLGEIEQTPSKYSAIKINGKKSYQLARANIEFTLPKRKINIYSIEILNQEENSFLVRVKCSKGTYIRALCEDIAEKIDSFAYLSFLMRTSTGGFNIKDSHTLNEVEQYVSNNEYDFLIDLESSLSFLNKLYFDDYLFEIITTGTPIDLTKVDLDVNFQEYYGVYCKNILIGIGKRTEDFLKIVSMLYIGEKL